MIDAPGAAGRGEVDAAPTLVVLAAGMGSRFGGPKQLEPVGPHGETMMEYGIFDALRAGFGEVVVITRPELEERIRAVLDARVGARAPIRYVFQLLEDLPTGFIAPTDRSKPWGTGHAVLCAEPAVERAFGVVNADDFYGLSSYGMLGEFLVEGRGSKVEGRAAGSGGREAGGVTALEGTARHGSVGELDRSASSPVPRPSSPSRPSTLDPRPSYSVIGFPLGATLSPEGGVNRARLDADPHGWLVHTEEIRAIERRDDGAVYRDATGQERALGLEQQVSMNMWGFTPEFFPQLREGFVRFLEANGADPKAEFLLPTVVEELITAARARVRVLPGGGPWCGVTYPQDKPKVTAEITALVARGEYPSPLWR